MRTAALRPGRHHLLLLLPAALLLGVFAVWPVFQALLTSLTDADLLAGTRSWVGLENYRRLLGDPRLGQVARATGWFVGGSVALQVGCGLAGALALHHAGRAGRWLRALAVVPYTLSELVVGILWLWILDTEFGVANSLVVAAGGAPQAWLLDWAMPAAVLANVWWGTAFALLLFEAALKAIPVSLYEAARVDGAGPWGRWRWVTLPSLRYTGFLVLVYVGLFTLNTFGILFVLTFGGPGHATEVAGLFMWKVAFRDYSLGLGAAVAVLLFAVNVLLTAAALRVFGREVLVGE